MDRRLLHIAAAIVAIVLFVVVFPSSNRDTTEADTSEPTAEVTEEVVGETCGGTPVEAPTESLRSLHYDGAGTLWMGAGSGNMYAMREGGFELCAQLGAVVNSIVTIQEFVLLATDGEGVFIYDTASGELEQFTTEEGGMPDNRFYNLYLFEGEVLATSWNGIAIFNPEFGWGRFDLFDLPLAPQNYHAILFSEGRWFLGTINAGLQVFDTSTQDWKIYRENMFHVETQPGVWSPEAFNGFVPPQVRDLIEWDGGVLLAGDHEENGLVGLMYVGEELMTSESGALPVSNLTAVAAYQNTLAVTDWQNGAYLFVGNRWVETSERVTPAFDVTFDQNGTAFFATASGLEIIDPATLATDD